MILMSWFLQALFPAPSFLFSPFVVLVLCGKEHKRGERAFVSQCRKVIYLGGLRLRLASFPFLCILFPPNRQLSRGVSLVSSGRVNRERTGAERKEGKQRVGRNVKFYGKAQTCPLILHSSSYSFFFREEVFRGSENVPPHENLH